MARHLVFPLLLGFPLGLQAAEVPFDDSLMLSSMYISSSQSYQIKKQKCDVAGVFTQGNLIAKSLDITFEGKSQGGGFECGQSLDENALVLGFRGDIQQSTMDGVIVRFEDLTTTYAPYLAFQVTPGFSLGVSEETTSAEVKNHTGSFSSSTHRLLVSGTWHDGPWEATLAYSDRFRSTFASSFDIPRSLDLAFRYEFSPLLTAGFVYSRLDYPGIATDDEPKVIGRDLALVIALKVSDDLHLELSHAKENDANGDDGSWSLTAGIMGQYALTPEVRVGGFLKQYKGDSPAVDTRMSAYGFNLAFSR